MSVDPQGARLTYGRAGLEMVRCPVCGVPIRTMIEGDSVRSQNIGSQLIVHRQIFLGILPNYREAHVEMQDPMGGLSKHVFSICATCGDNLTKEQAQEIHDTDPERITDNLLSMRNVTKILDVNFGGQP